MAILEISGVLRNSSRWYIDVSWFFKKRLDILYRMCDVKLVRRSIAIELHRHSFADYSIVASFAILRNANTDMHELRRMCAMFGINCLWPESVPTAGGLIGTMLRNTCIHGELLCNVRWTPEEFGLTVMDCEDMYAEALYHYSNEN